MYFSGYTQSVQHHTTQRVANYWMFGNGLAMDFNCNPPNISQVGNVYLREGSASIASRCGDLKFYTDGDSIWHFGHFPYQDTVFPLNGSKFATQSALILPSKNVLDKYWLFTIDDTIANMHGLSYTEIEQAGTAPGIFPAGQANQVLSQNTTEMIAATDHADGESYWVVVKIKNQNEFHAYFVSDAGGVDPTPVISLGGTSGDESGQMKFSPSGEFLVISSPLQIFKFNNSTGEISEYLSFTNAPGDDWAILGRRSSIAFSPSSRFLYVPNYGLSFPLDGSNTIFQIDLEETDTVMLKATISNIAANPFDPTGGMQLGPDGKIYVIESDGFNLGVINNPELAGSDADLQRNIIQLDAQSGLFFPTFNQSWFSNYKPLRERKFCSEDSTHFEILEEAWESDLGGVKIDSMRWIFGDPLSGSKDTAWGEKPSHKFTAPGCYTVTLRVYASAASSSPIEKIKLIRIKESPTLSLGDGDTTLCIKPRLITFFASSVNNPGATYDWYYDTLNAPIGDPEGEMGTNPKFPIATTETFKADIPGKYWVKKSWNCCVAWDTMVVYHDSITPRFIVNDNLQCLLDNDFKFTNTSVPSVKPNSTKWDFGPGGKQTGEVVNVKFNQNGAFYPTMSTESGDGCKAKLTRIVLVVKHPEARFFVDSTQQCFNNNVFAIRDSSTIEFGQGGLQKWAFDLGDGFKTGLKQFTKSYTKPGEYDISLIVTSSQDCRDTAITTVKVFEQPKAGFTINDTSQCLSANDFEFKDTSFSDSDTINSRHWTYGDGSPVDDRTGLPLEFNRNYGSVDSFLVSLKVSTGIGCFDTARKYVYVHGDPFVDFSIDNAEQCLDGNEFNFTDTTFTEKGFVQTKLWNFGDGSPISNSGLNKSYTNYGAYNIQLRVITNDGCTDSITKSVLLNPMPNAAFTVDKTISCFKDHSFTFSAAPSFIPVGTIDTYNWDFGDGTTDNVKDPLPKVFATDGNKTVILELISNKGCIDSAQRVIQFYPTPVAVASVNDDTQCLEENLFNYSASGSTANGGNIKEYLWQFGDGTIDFGENPPGKFYVNPDTFNVLLQITTDDNCTDTATVSVYTLPSPIANFSVDPTCLFQPSEFKNKSTSSPGFITNWSWNLGDGTITNDSNPTHTYANTGNYTITLNVLSNFGCEAKATKVNEAEVKPLPQARFGIEKIDFDAKNTTIQFIDSSIDANQWYWDLGMGNLSTIQNPQFQYNDTVTLPVTLIISNAKGCFDTLTKSIFVAPDFFFHVPNAFTPNKDPLNPTYGGEGTLYYQEYSLKVYNRWGQKVFESDSPLKRWDGTYRGKDCIEGQYTYVYLLRDVYGFYHNYKGVLTLFR
jgi:gliding motility-associated-like protein